MAVGGGDSDSVQLKLKICDGATRRVIFRSFQVVEGYSLLVIRCSGRKIRMSQNNNNVQEEWPVHNSQSADGPSMRGRVPFVAAFKFQLNIFDWGIRDFFLLLLLLLLLFIVGWLPFLFSFFFIFHVKMVVVGCASAGIIPQTSSLGWKLTQVKMAAMALARVSSSNPDSIAILRDSSCLRLGLAAALPNLQFKL